MLSDAIHALKIPKAAVAYQREHGALWVRDEALVAHLRRASADGALRRCGAVSGRLFSASSAQPNQVGTSGDISGTGRAPLGFDSGMFRARQSGHVHAVGGAFLKFVRGVHRASSQSFFCKKCDLMDFVPQKRLRDAQNSRRVPRQELFMCTDPPIRGEWTSIRSPTD